MQNLYRLEEHLRETRAGPKLRAMARNLEARPVMERLHRLLLTWKNKHSYLPQSAMGKAIDYALEQWSSFLLYLDDGRLEIDTNLVENAIRPTAVGKKNWLFIGEAAAGDRSAIIYTVIESCRRRGIDPFAYLRDVFARQSSTTNYQLPTGRSRDQECHARSLGRVAQKLPPGRCIDVIANSAMTL